MKLLKKCEITKQQEKYIWRFIMGDYSSREAGKKLNVSHQTVFNLSIRYLREWFQTRNARFEEQFPMSKEEIEYYKRLLK